MGLLDDAIREHLELKRLRGADPGDVAREEQAALGPIHRDGESEPDGSGDDNTEASHMHGASSPHSGQGLAVDSSTAGQETIEINMEAELAASDSEHEAAPGDSQSLASKHSASAQVSAEDSLEWEMPGDSHADHTPAAVPEGEVDAGSDTEQETPEPVEDVLEETPDFLRDTPEQERLWFEQRPPRDFDFNE
jgi:hypothetical protein